MKRKYSIILWVVFSTFSSLFYNTYEVWASDNEATEVQDDSKKRSFPITNSQLANHIQPYVTDTSSGLEPKRQRKEEERNAESEEEEKEGENLSVQQPQAQHDLPHEEVTKRIYIEKEVRISFGQGISMPLLYEEDKRYLDLIKTIDENHHYRTDIAGDGSSPNHLFVSFDTYYASEGGEIKRASIGYHFNEPRSSPLEDFPSQPRYSFDPISECGPVYIKEHSLAIISRRGFLIKKENGQLIVKKCVKNPSSTSHSLRDCEDFLIQNHIDNEYIKDAHNFYTGIAQGYGHPHSEISALNKILTSLERDTPNGIYHHILASLGIQPDDNIPDIRAVIIKFHSLKETCGDCEKAICSLHSYLQGKISRKLELSFPLIFVTNNLSPYQQTSSSAPSDKVTKREININEPEDTSRLYIYVRSTGK